MRINYDEAYKHNFRSAVRDATKFFLGMGVGEGLVLSPQALNPFLRVMETLDCVKQIAIFPAFETTIDGKETRYLIMKLPEAMFAHNVDCLHE